MSYPESAFESEEQGGATASLAAQSPRSPSPDLDQHRRPFDMGKPKNWFCDSRSRKPLTTKDHVMIELWYSADDPNLCWRYMAPVKDGVYSVLEDHELRSVTRFPLIPFLIYDVSSAKFIGIPTFSRIEVRDDEYFILRNAGCAARPQDVPTLWVSILDLLAQTRMYRAQHTNVPPTLTPAPMQLPTPTTSRSLNPSTPVRRSPRFREPASSSPSFHPVETPTRIRRQKRPSN